MQINLIDANGNTLDYAETHPDLHRCYSDSSLVFESLENAFDIQIQNFSSLVDDEKVTIPALEELVSLSVFSVPYKRSDDDTRKKFHRLVTHSNGLSWGRISRDEGATTFRGFQRQIQHVWSILLGICFKRGLNEDVEKIIEYVKGEFQNHLKDIEENDAQMLVCSAPSISMIFSYIDPDLEEKVVESLDMAVLSCCTVDDSQRIVFTPERYEMDKTAMQTYLRIAFGLVLEKYIEKNDLHLRDAVLRDCLIAALWQHFISYVNRVPHLSRSGYRRGAGNLYAFAKNQTEESVVVEATAEV